MSIDPDEVFRKLEERRAAGLLPSDITKKIDYDKMAKDEFNKLKESLGCADMSDEEFISLYQMKRQADSDRSLE